MTTLVTGAASPFGRRLMTRLRAAGESNAVGTTRNAAPEAGLVSCDVTDADRLTELVASLQPSVVFHLAARYDGPFDAAMAVNAWSARTILEAVASAGLSTRTVLVGTAAEYGAVAPEDNPVTEARAPAPVSLYGTGKATQTLIASHYARDRGANVVVGRMFNLRMPGLAERLFLGRVERAIAAVRSGQQETIRLGNLEAVRDYVDADMAIEQLLDIAARGIAGEVYHVASGRPTRIGDLLDELLAEARLDRGIVETVQGQAVRPGYDVPVIYADISRTMALHGG